MSFAVASSLIVPVPHADISGSTGAHNPAPRTTSVCTPPGQRVCSVWARPEVAGALRAGATAAHRGRAARHGGSGCRTARGSGRLAAAAVDVMTSGEKPYLDALGPSLRLREARSGRA